MARCNHCGNEVVLPFSCQYCRGRYCPGCRLPPNHNCVNIGLWNSKPRPAVGISYGKGGGATPTGGGYSADSLRTAEKRPGEGIPYRKIMIAIVFLILVGFALLVLGGYRFG
jgi:hypothetical protein